MPRDPITSKTKPGGNVAQKNAKKANKVREMPKGVKVDKKLTRVAQAAFDGSGRERDLIGKKVKVGDYDGEVMAQWREGDHTIVTVKVDC
jgi:hypothetical protein